MVWPRPRGHGAKSPPPVRELHAYPWRRAVSESIVAAAESLCQSLRGFDPELYSGSDCAAIVEKLGAAEKLSSSVRVRAALRAADCGAHRAAGFADAAEWLARRSGTSFGAARAAMDTAGGPGELPRHGGGLRRRRAVAESGSRDRQGRGRPSRLGAKAPA